MAEGIGRRRFLGWSGATAALAAVGGAAALTVAATGCAPVTLPSGDVVDPLDVVWPPDERRRLWWRSPRNPNAPLRLPTGSDRRVLVVGGGLAGLSAALELAERGYAVSLREAAPEFGGRLATRTLDPGPGVGRSFRVEHGLHMWFDNYRVFLDIRRRLGIDGHFRPYDEVNFVFRDYLPEKLSSDPKVFPFNLAAIVDRSPNLDWPDILGTARILPDLVGFDLDGLYERHDNETFFEWIDRNEVPEKFRDIVLQPAAHVTLNRDERLSAAEMLLYQHLYFISQPYAFDREITSVDHGTAVIDPWVRRIADLGGDCRTGAPVAGLVFDGDRVAGVVGEPGVYDWVVLACDVKGVKAVLEGSRTLQADGAAALGRISDRLAPQHTAPPYRILRVWFDRQPSDDRPDVIECPQHEPIALIAQFHLLEEESRQWAASTGGAVIEFHLYSLEGPIATAADDEVWYDIRPVVLEILPEMADAIVLGQTIGDYDNFTSFEAGTGLTRPSPWTLREDGVTNLMLAGDWVQAPTPSALMERAVVTGRLAANECLLADGVRESGYQHVSPLGPLV